MRFEFEIILVGIVTWASKLRGLVEKHTHSSACMPAASISMLGMVVLGCLFPLIHSLLQVCAPS